MLINVEPEEHFYPALDYVVFRRCTPDWRMPPQKLKVFDITYVIKGNAEYTIDDEKHTLSPGMILCLPPGTYRKGVTFDGCPMHCFSVNFHLISMGGGGGTHLPLNVINSIGCRNDLISLFHELSGIWQDKFPGYHIKAAGVFLLILHRILELTVYNFDSAAGDYRLRKIVRYIMRHYSEKISVRRMASMVKLDAAYLGKLFKSEMGVSIKQYLMKTRIKNAELMLRNGEYRNIGMVAEHCGYVDPYQFSKQFKAIMGFPPSKCIPKHDG